VEKAARISYISGTFLLDPTMFSFLTSWRKRLQGAPAKASTLDLPSVMQFAMQFNQRPGLTLVLGDARVGKSTLLQGALQQLQGCVVHLRLSSQPMAGWREAPFYGLFIPEVGDELTADLPEVLRSRIPGRFHLEMPKDVMTGDSSFAQEVRTRLGELLRQPLMDSVPHSKSFRLVLLVDSGEHVLCHNALQELLRYGRSANCHLVLAVQGAGLFNERFQADVKHLVAFKSTDPQAPLVEHLFEDVRVRLGQLTPGQFWHKVVPTAELRLLELPGNTAA